MTQNTTGLELDNSHKINVRDCVASCNTHAGYCLISSTTCCLLDSKALSTGEGNVDIDTTSVQGFVTRDGYANIFERCIANSTQALSVTGSSSIIAGFSFRGTEQCSKIINSEAANSTTDPDEFTVPYGIFLEGTIDSTQSVTGSLSGTVQGVDWSPDGQYVAVGGTTITGGTDDDFQIFRFDRAAGGVTTIATYWPSGDQLTLSIIVPALSENMPVTFCMLSIVPSRKIPYGTVKPSGSVVLFAASE